VGKNGFWIENGFVERAATIMVAAASEKKLLRFALSRSNEHSVKFESRKDGENLSLMKDVQRVAILLAKKLT
jgi:hypothetical protein